MPFARRGLTALLLLCAAGALHAQLPPQAQAALEKGVLAAKQQEYALAIRYFQEARKSAPAAPAVLFNLGLAESKIAGRELRAMTWFRAYLAASPDAANAAAVNEQINALEVGNNVNLSRILNTAQQAIGQFPKPTGFVDPRDYALDRVIRLWARSGDYAAALQAADRFTWEMPKAGARADVAVIQADAGDISGALRTVEGPFGRGQNPGQDDSITSFRGYALASIAAAQARTGDKAGAESTLTRARQTIEKLPAAGAAFAWQAIWTAQAAIGEAQAKAGDGAGSRRTFSGARDGAAAIADVHYKVLCYAAIAKAQVAAGDRVGGLETMTLALHRVEDVRDDFSRELTLRDVALAQAAVGDFAGARKTADRIQKETSMREHAQRGIAGEEVKLPVGRSAGDWAALNDTLFNGPVFLDPAGYLKSLPAAPSKAFDGLIDAAEKIVEAHEAIDRRLKLTRK